MKLVEMGSIIRHLEKTELLNNTTIHKKSSKNKTKESTGFLTKPLILFNDLYLDIHINRNVELIH